MLQIVTNYIKCIKFLRFALFTDFFFEISSKVTVCALCCCILKTDWLFSLFLNLDGDSGYVNKQVGHKYFILTDKYGRYFTTKFTYKVVNIMRYCNRTSLTSTI